LLLIVMLDWARVGAGVTVSVAPFRNLNERLAASLFCIAPVHPLTGMWADIAPLASIPPGRVVAVPLTGMIAGTA
jgi:hypothetical protein